VFQLTCVIVKLLKSLHDSSSIHYAPCCCNKQVESFSKGDGHPQLLFFYQHQLINETQRTPDAVLFSPDLEHDRLEGRCIYFVRTVVRDIDPDRFESDVSIGEFSPPQTFETIELLLSELHGSILHSRHYKWNKLNEDSIHKCLSAMDQLLSQVQQTVSSNYVMQLAGLEQSLLEDVRVQEEKWNKLALDDTTFGYLSTILEQWCSQVVSTNIYTCRMHVKIHNVREIGGEKLR
jgi:hypothetical protein